MEIKFRAWDINGKGFVNGFNMFGYSLGQGAPKRKLQRFNDEWNEGDFVLMQYTGLKDKNGKEIYEGDIISGQYNVGSVIFMHGSYQIQWDINPYNCSYLLTYADEQEIVGNIYENPELLK